MTGGEMENKDRHERLSADRRADGAVWSLGWMRQSVHCDTSLIDRHHPRKPVAQCSRASRSMLMLWKTASANQESRATTVMCVASLETRQPALVLDVFGRREIARIDRIGEKRFLAVSPELADVRVGLENRIDQPAIIARDLSQVNIADHIAGVIELDRPACGIDIDRPQCGHEGGLVFDLAVHRLEGGF